MSIEITTVTVSSILTRTSGFLSTVAPHSLQPYRGCTFGNSLCGVGCYVQHNAFLTRGRRWGSFLEARINAAELYVRHQETERQWARKNFGQFGIFMSSSTDPFVPQEDCFKVTRSILEAMMCQPPDFLIIQTHTHRVVKYLDLYPELARRCELRFHISIESDIERLPGLPPPASTIARRLGAAYTLRATGLRVVITVSPLFPIENPQSFFERIAAVADAAVIDHFIEGDGTPNGSRTLKTPLPGAMRGVLAESVHLEYRNRIVEIARQVMPGRIGVCVDGFAGRFLQK